MRDFLRQFLLYSRSERRAVVTLVFLIVIVILIPRVCHFYFVKPLIAYQDTAIAKQIVLVQKDSGGALSSEKIDTGKIYDSLFYFDPNTIGTDDWIRLGLSEKQAAVIEKYKSKGGRFRRPDDLRKIYVLSDDEKNKLVPYVRLEKTNDLASNKTSNTHFSIEINSADSSQFQQLYGIGPVLSSRIIKFRGLLGGFYSIDQIGETYGISDTVFLNIKPHLKVNSSLVNRININDADYETLRKHPYIHAKIAHAIIGYRNMNGKFESLDELKKLKLINDDVFEKIVPYLKISS